MDVLYRLLDKSANFEICFTQRIQKYTEEKEKHLFFYQTIVIVLFSFLITFAIQMQNNKFHITISFRPPGQRPRRGHEAGNTTSRDRHNRIHNQLLLLLDTMGVQTMPAERSSTTTTTTPTTKNSSMQMPVQMSRLVLELVSSHTSKRKQETGIHTIISKASNLFA